MFAEIDVLGASAPAIAVWLLACLLLFIPVDRVLTKRSFYRLFWHAPLVRLALFGIFFFGGALALSTI